MEKEQREVYQVSRVDYRPVYLTDAISIQRFSPQFLLMRLRHSITAQDDKSEALASVFIQQQPSAVSSTGTGTANNGMEIDEFMREYKELRKVYHKRVIWNEKWTKGQVEWRDD